MNTANSTFRVVEQFISINGEGRRAGQLALFIRFAGCNLNCDYCDTKWANEPDVAYKEYSLETLYHMIKESGVKNVTLTGGEPLIQPNIEMLLDRLRQDSELRVEIETNGSVEIVPFMSEQKLGKSNGDVQEMTGDNVSFTLDYKTSASGMEHMMCMTNYENIRPQDTVKFVVGGTEDLHRAKKIIESYHLVEKGCGIFLSPCFGKIEPADMVDFLVEHRLNDVNIQLQLHKFIWNPDKRGV